MPTADTDSQAVNEMSARARRDLTLITAALAGDSSAYEELMRRYRKPVYHTVLKMVRNAADAEDLTMEAFAKAFRYLPRYRPDFAFSTWLLRIATNNSIDYLRRKRLNTHSLDAGLAVGDGETVPFDVPTPDRDPYEALLRQQRLEIMRRVVTLLPPKYEQLVRFRYFDELSYEEIATELQVPMGTIKAQLFRARELMLALVENSRGAL